MKIVHVITSLYTGGAEKLMVDLLPRIQEHGHDVELVLFDGTKTPFFGLLQSTKVKIHSLSIGGSVYNPILIWKLRKILETADIVHTHNTSPQLFTAIASKLNLKSKPVLITTEHNTTNRRRSIPLLKWIDRWMYKQYSRIICISDQAAINLNHYLQELKTKSVVVYNGVDLSRYSSVHPTISKHDEKVIVTMVAAFRKQKDQSTLIRAISLLPEKYELQLVGTGDADLIESCKNLATELKLTDRVHFMGMRTDVPDLLQQSDIIVLSSHYEGLSLSSIEGMASGRPFVSSDVEGLHEIVSGYGELFPHENSKDLADIIVRLSEDKAYARQVSDRCCARASQFDISVMEEKYNTMYTLIK